MARKPILRTLFRTALLGRCPECGRTSIFSGYLAMHERCSECDLRYQTSSGAWLGAIAIGYGLGALVALVLAFVEIAYRPIRDLGLDPAWTIVVVSLLMTGFGYRWAKSTWFALLYLGEFMAFGDQPPGPPPVNPGGSQPIEPRVR